MSDKLDYFIAALDMHLASGKTPPAALLATVEDYAAVWHAKDNRTMLARAATVALERLREDEQARG